MAAAAKSSSTFTTLAATLLLTVSTFGGLAGCQAPKQRMVVDTLPPQNFNGPSLAAKPAPAPTTPTTSTQVTPQPKIYIPPPPVARGPGSTVPAEWVPRTTARPWKWIVIHHSATPTGGAAAFDRMHRAKGWDELGYDFVIGNGTDTRDGQIEVGSRWPVQKQGAHTKTPDNRFNELGIGICLVGNFDKTNPTPEQMRSVTRLVSYLMRKYNIPPDCILGHGQAKATDCPGRYMSVAEVRRRSSQAIADAGDIVPANTSPPVAANLLRELSPIRR
jgi:N-acetylmuramoyl-L-alanine amidase